MNTIRNGSYKRTWYNRMPSRLPPSYVAKTVARLLPSPSELLKLDRPALLKVLAEKQKLSQLIEEDPVRFFQPALSGGQRDFMTNIDHSIQGRYFFAANKTGKTTAGAIVSGEIAEGRALWGSNWRPTSPWLIPRQKKLAFFAEDFATHEESIVPTYASWMKQYIHDIVKGPSGNISRVIHKNGSTIYLRTYDQGYEKAEGKDYDLVWCDEPPPRDIYTAIFRGLVATKGLLLITATLLAETWLYDEITQPFVKVFDATMYDNDWLDSEARKNFEAMLTDEEKSIRIYGKPSSLSGSIYPSFKSRRPSPFIIDQQEPPWDPVRDKPWPVVLGIDPHERKPIYAAWAYLTPDGKLIWFDWDLVPSGSIKSIFKRLNEKEASHKVKSTLVVMDPNRGVAKQIDGQSWKEAFEANDFPVLLGNDDLAHGHFVVREMFDEPISMFFMEACQGKDGPIYCLDRYTWEDWVRGSRFEKGPKEKPKEKFKDFPDIIRYVAVALYDGQITFHGLSEGDDVIDTIGEDVRVFGNPYIN